MRPIAILLALACVVFAADKKQVSGYGEAGNDNADFVATVYLDPSDIHDVLGADLPPGYVVAKVKAKVKTGDAMRLSPDDFVLVSRKNGDRADAIAPSQIPPPARLPFVGISVAAIGRSKPMSPVLPVWVPSNARKAQKKTAGCSRLCAKNSSLTKTRRTLWKASCIFPWML